MGYAPLGARKERLQDVPSQYLQGLDCEEIRIQSSDNSARLSGLIVRPKGQSGTPNLVAIYFQGNAGNPLHRLPVFQALLSALRLPNINPAILAVAPRSYWTSTPKHPSQAGILSDYTTVLHHAAARFPSAHIVLYGHSLGGAVALCLLSKLKDTHVSTPPRIQGLILENPFASIPGMLVALYPQRWIPYRHLQSFVYDRWDALGALQTQEREGRTALSRLSKKMLVLVSEHDEVVPPEMGAQIVRAAMGSNAWPTRGTAVHGGPEDTRTQLVEIPGALHENAWNRPGWARAVRTYVRGILWEAEVESKREKV
ncbi:hypothetical protein DXG03_009715 [Asterophora parasitica]|uniref:Serine aminopeptidase S33 domain-containing protein n=1 Tax=Asterophora parasitica TaxID=117018 RepID=A0A9P7KCC3_9AGAR|nr:hypothetical protein DXG03_009715 [Asterophora parasitica]